MAIGFEQILIQTVNGIVNGMILALVASGLTLIFGIMDVVNFAHGDLVMLGGFVGAVTIAATGNFWLALLVAAVVIAVFGAVLQATTLRPLIGRDPLTTILATFGISLVLQKYAIWQWGPSARRIQEPITGNFSFFYLQYPWYRILTAVLATAIIGALYLFLRYGKYGIWIRATTQDRVMAQAMGIPVPLVHTGRLRHRCRHGRRLRRALRTPRRRDAEHRARFHAAGLHRGGGRRDGQPRRLDLRRDPHQPARGLRLAHRQPGPGGDRLLRGPDSHAALPAHGPLRPDAEVSPSVDDPRRSSTAYWTGFAVILALLIIAPLVLPEFWRRFVTEILIWGLLAMSSDILIGYTGMVSFGHSVFFGLGMYGAAAALLSVKPPNLWLAILYGLAGAIWSPSSSPTSPRGCATSTSPSRRSSSRRSSTSSSSRGRR